MHTKCYFLLILLFVLISVQDCSRIRSRWRDREKILFRSPNELQKIKSKLKSVYKELEEYTKERKKRDIKTAKLYQKRDSAMQRYLKGLNVQVVDGHDKV